jgi:hypothetical protein
VNDRELDPAVLELGIVGPVVLEKNRVQKWGSPASRRTASGRTIRAFCHSVRP